MMRVNRSLWPLSLAALLWAVPGMAGAPDEDFPDPDMAATDAVNTGPLVLLPAMPADRPVHHHDTEIILTRASLADGWAHLRQCHAHLDPVSRVELVYNVGRIRHLRVVSSSGIGKAWVEGVSIQLRDVGEDARLCVEAESRVVEKRPEGEFVVQNGPFMRRFLDGYYPMRVTLSLRLPAGLRLVGTEPPVQPGFRVERSGDRIQVEAWFEGRLMTRIHLRGVD